MLAYANEAVEPVFRAWPKIYHLYRPVLITEKIDGTNAAVGITDDGRVYAQSRKRLITPDDDNHGFATFVYDHADEFRDTLGEGLHFGEWHGPGINKRYSREQAPGFGDEKRLALFDAKRWRDEPLPARVTTVPVLYDGIFDEASLQAILTALRASDDAAPSGTTNPEGVVVHFVQSRASFKVTLENDEMSKGEAKARGLLEYV